MRKYVLFVFSFKDQDLNDPLELGDGRGQLFGLDGCEEVSWSWMHPGGLCFAYWLGFLYYS